MAWLPDLAKRLASMSVGEMADRSRQAAWRAAGRVGLTRDSTSHQPLPFSQRVMLPAFLDMGATAEAFRRHCPEGVGKITSQAERILDGRFSLLGFRALEFGDPIDWHRDPVNSRQAPRTHFSRIDPLDSASVGDHKIIWELNRHGFLLHLSRAFVLTGDERYAERAHGLIRHWMVENPPEEGINWHSSLEVALRTLNWLQVWPVFAHLPTFDGLRSEWLGSIDRHARHVARYLSHHFAPNTHLTGEALALVSVGLLLPELPLAGQYRRLGRRVFDREIERQLLSDGFHYERSAAYHRYTVEYLLMDLLVSSLNGIEDVRTQQTRLAAAVEAMLPLTRPDGTLVNIGDEDGGRMLQVDGGEPLRTATLVACSALLLDRGDFKATLSELPADVMWILGPEAGRRWDMLDESPPPDGFRMLPEAGYVSMRDGWSEDASYCLLDAGPLGTSRTRYGHSHADALSLCLVARGREITTDPGTGSYSDDVVRDRLRGTLSHSTAWVDGLPHCRPTSRFRWDQTAEARIIRWETSRKMDLVEASHDGYATLTPPVGHHRTVVFRKSLDWLIRDRFEGEASRTVTIQFVLPFPRKRVEREGALRIRTPAGVIEVQPCPAAEGDPDPWGELIDLEASPRYGRWATATAFRVSVRTELPTELLSRVSPLERPGEGEQERECHIEREAATPVPPMEIG